MLKKLTPNIMVEDVSRTVKFYKDLTETLLVQHINLDMNSYVERYFDKHLTKYVVIVAGSTSDSEYIEKLIVHAKELNIFTKIVICSAHKNTKELVKKIDEWNELKSKSIVFIAVAGRSNALGSVLAANLHKFPVISCPPFKDKSDFNININSSLQNPSNVPSLTILDPKNAMLAAQKILGRD